MARAIRAAAESAPNNRAQPPPPPHNFRTVAGGGRRPIDAQSPLASGSGRQQSNAARRAHAPTNHVQQARIVTKYSILQRHEGKQIKRRDKAAEQAAAAGTSDADKDSAAAAVQDRRQQPDRPKAVLVIKTYDPASGVCLKYKTNKAAEVGRLVASLEKLARTMAALPDKPDGDIPMLDVPAEQATDTSTPNPDAKVEAKPSQGGGGGGGGGGKKKKKGKK